MGWLVSDAHVLASAEVAADRRARRRGLLDGDGFEGALVLRPCRWVHTVGMRFALTSPTSTPTARSSRRSAWPGTASGSLFRRRHGSSRPQAAAFERWGLSIGDVVELREGPDPSLGNGD